MSRKTISDRHGFHENSQNTFEYNSISIE